jgi:hypothetical protein
MTMSNSNSGDSTLNPNVLSSLVNQALLVAKIEREDYTSLSGDFRSVLVDPAQFNLASLRPDSNQVSAKFSEDLVFLPNAPFYATGMIVADFAIRLDSDGTILESAISVSAAARNLSNCHTNPFGAKGDVAKVVVDSAAILNFIDLEGDLAVDLVAYRPPYVPKDQGGDGVSRSAVSVKFNPLASRTKTPENAAVWNQTRSIIAQRLAAQYEVLGLTPKADYLKVTLIGFTTRVAEMTSDPEKPTFLGVTLPGGGYIMGVEPITTGGAAYFSRPAKTSLAVDASRRSRASAAVRAMLGKAPAAPAVPTAPAVVGRQADAGKADPGMDWGTVDSAEVAAATGQEVVSRKVITTPAKAPTVAATATATGVRPTQATLDAFKVLTPEGRLKVWSLVVEKTKSKWAGAVKMLERYGSTPSTEDEWKKASGHKWSNAKAAMADRRRDFDQLGDARLAKIVAWVAKNDGSDGGTAAADPVEPIAPKSGPVVMPSAEPVPTVESVPATVATAAPAVPTVESAPAPAVGNLLGLISGLTSNNAAAALQDEEGAVFGETVPAEVSNPAPVVSSEPEAPVNTEDDPQAQVVDLDW